MERMESALLRIAEYATGVTLVAVTCVLFCGVVARYGAGAPLTWSDDLASILFLWLGMLGAVVAYCRLQHMRMGTMVAGLSPRAQEIVAGLSLIAELFLFGALLLPSIHHAADEATILSGSLGQSGLWRSLAMPVGLGLMLIFALFRLLKVKSFRYFGIALAIALAIGGALVLSAPLLGAIGNLRLLIFFLLLGGGAILLGVPIAFAFCVSTLSYLALATHAPIGMVVSRVEAGMSHFILLAVPTFVFLGVLMEITGMAKALVGFLAMLVGHLRGGLHYVLIAAMYLVSGISGAKTADMAAVVPALFPEMKKRGEDEGELVALLSVTGIQTETIPPSLVLITVGSVTGVSIAALFAGGMLPALVLGLMLAAVVFWRHRRDPVRRPAARARGDLVRALAIASPALALPFLIRSAVVEGVATATEVSTIGIAYALLYGAFAATFLKVDVKWRLLWSAVVDSASLSGAILFVIGATTAMAWGLTQSGFSSQLARAMTDLPGGAVTFLLISILLFFVLGTVLEGIPAMVLFAPLMFPIARQIGIHPVHYAMVTIFSMGIGLFCPPFGIGYYIACGIARIDPAKGLKPILSYLVAIVLGTVLVALVPWFSIGFLPTPR